jgi:hypothetical protein
MFLSTFLQGACVFPEADWMREQRDSFSAILHTPLQKRPGGMLFFSLPSTFFEGREKLRTRART